MKERPSDEVQVQCEDRLLYTADSSCHRELYARTSPLPADMLEVQAELELKTRKRTCSSCGVNEVYLDIYTQDLCEPCIYRIAMSGDS